MMSFAPAITTVPDIKLLVNVGMLHDIPTGTWMRGQKGEMLLCGGLSAFDAQTGEGNTFKSTIVHERNLTALDRLTATNRQSSISVYDTEQNIQPKALARLIRKYGRLMERNIMGSGEFSIADKTTMYGDENWKAQIAFIQEVKLKNAKSLYLETPFLDHNNMPFRTLPITLHFTDSLSKWETKEYVTKYRDKNIGVSERNTANMKRGLDTSSYLEEISIYGPKGMHYESLTAHIGMSNGMAVSGPPGTPPPKKLSTMKNGQVLKGGTDNLYYLPHHLYYNQGSKPALDSNNNPLYARNEYELTGRDNTDLYEIKIKQLRSKNGPTNYVIPIILSQADGVSQELTHINFIRENLLKAQSSGSEYYGTTGGNSKFKLCLYPTIFISRNDAYQKLNEDYKLARAAEITCDLIQMRLMNQFPQLYLHPHELYEKIKEQGLDWNRLLETRGWWTYDNYDDTLLPFLSTFDLLEIAHGLKKPFWY